MKCFLGAKYRDDEGNRELVEGLKSVLEEAGFEVSCVVLEGYGSVETVSAEELMDRTFSMLRSCDLVVIELSEKGVGLGVEAGFARAIGLPVFTVLKNGCVVSRTLKGVSEEVVRYDDVKELQDFFAGVRKNLEE